MDCSTCILRENCPYRIPTTGIIHIPLEKIYETIIENLSATGVIVPEEFDTYRGMLREMPGQQLIETLLESHIRREKQNALIS